MGNLVARAYNRFEVDRALGCITKSSNNQRIQDEINYYRTLPPELCAFFPRLMSSDIANDVSKMTLEYYDYPNLGEYLLDTHASLDWSATFERLLAILRLWSRHGAEDGVAEYSRQMYVRKTEDEYHRLVESYSLDLFSAKEIYINGKPYKNFEGIWPQASALIERLLIPYRASFFHGDCCFSNILFGARQFLFRFIDPRGSFGKRGYIGDLRYDVAKLYHSCHGGYEFLINDRYNLELGSSSRYTVELPRHANGCLVAFEDVFLSQFKRQEIALIEGLIYVGMAARHYDCDRRQAAMYLSGVKFLNEVLES